MSPHRSPRPREKADYDGKLRCSDCRLVKSVRDNFYLGGDGAPVLRCIPCCVIYQRKWTNRVVLVVPLVTVSASNKRESWRARSRRVLDERNAVLARWLALERPTLPKAAVIRLTRIARRKLDDDNLRGALKAVRDEVAALIGVDDGSPDLRWKYRQVIGPPSVEIVIREK